MKRLVPIILPLALAACSPSTPSGQAPAATTSSATVAPEASTQPRMAGTKPTDKTPVSVLDRYHWQLATATNDKGQRLDAFFASTDKPLQLDFHTGRLGVTHTCNSMGAPFRLEDGKLQVGPVAQTMKACADKALVALDRAVGKFLEGDLAMTLEDSDDTPHLTLANEDGDTLVFAGHPTAQTRYGSQGTTVFMEVAAATVPCDHPPGTAKQCLKVRERHFDANGLKAGKPGPWHPLTQSIEGYTHQPGVRNVLRLKRFPVKNAPAGASSTAYVLDMVVESEVAR